VFFKGALDGKPIRLLCAGAVAQFTPVSLADAPRVVFSPVDRV